MPLYHIILKSFTTKNLPGNVNPPHHYVNKSRNNSSSSLLSHFRFHFSKKINNQFKERQKNVPLAFGLNMIIY